MQVPEDQAKEPTIEEVFDGAMLLIQNLLVGPRLIGPNFEDFAAADPASVIPPPSFGDLHAESRIELLSRLMSSLRNVDWQKRTEAYEALIAEVLTQIYLTDATSSVIENVSASGTGTRAVRFENRRNLRREEVKVLSLRELIRKLRIYLLVRLKKIEALHASYPAPIADFPEEKLTNTEVQYWLELEEKLSSRSPEDEFHIAREDMEEGKDVDDDEATATARDDERPMNTEEDEEDSEAIELYEELMKRTILHFVREKWGLSMRSRPPKTRSSPRTEPTPHYPKGAKRTRPKPASPVVNLLAAVKEDDLMLVDDDELGRLAEKAAIVLREQWRRKKGKRAAEEAEKVDVTKRRRVGGKASRPFQQEADRIAQVYWKKRSQEATAPPQGQPTDGHADGPATAAIAVGEGDLPSPRKSPSPKRQHPPRRRQRPLQKTPKAQPMLDTSWPPRRWQKRKEVAGRMQQQREEAEPAATASRATEREERKNQMPAEGPEKLKGPRIRRLWTEEEVQALEEGLVRFGPAWAKIAEKYTHQLHGRDGVNLRDKVTIVL
ncbi:hypothetical protein HK101_011453 [Irineochytrium annulatum]|nr:hypothetical protein HK101_011453 [Irineochytrium annulatum]